MSFTTSSRAISAKAASILGGHEHDRYESLRNKRPRLLQSQVFIRRVDSPQQEAEEEEAHENPEFKLPSKKSLFVIVGGNALFQMSFFIIVSSASVYAELLGGTATFSGLIIGIPPAISGLSLLFISRYDGGRYGVPLNISYISLVLGNILYALAYRAQWLYLLLIGRIVTGLSFIAFMYSKRFCTDPRLVGIRRRTTLAGWLVVGQAFGFSVGPFFGGLLYKVGFGNKVFNGVTSPGWIVAGVFTIFLVLSNLLLEDVPNYNLPPLNCQPPHDPSFSFTNSDAYRPSSEEPSFRSVTPAQWGVIICMCYYSMTCFFILGSWEANIPVFTASALGYSPYNAGNFIALGGISSFPFLLLNVWYARRIQDRSILAAGTTLGLFGLLIMLAILRTAKVTFGSLFICWFLIALGFNLASTCTLSLLSKQLPDTWNRKASMAIQYSNYLGRVTGAILGGAGVKMGMINYIAVQIGVVGLGGVMYLTLWRQLKAKTG
ncbi:membrane transporter [Gymnopilus junonius]|uniref:Membrane transporter n=1 Tax=Gymnopilus junonius TaxID=109634 RepID=A0A9P5NGR3_GYMJU|nr:membrane transporter [Gymnopilus junonius]